MFLVNNKWFRTIVILGDVWKEFGYNAVVYVAAMTAIDPGLYEAAQTFMKLPRLMVQTVGIRYGILHFLQFCQRLF